MGNQKLVGGIIILIVGAYLMFEIMTSLGFVWSSENLTPEQIPAFETASVIILVIIIGILPVGGYLIGNYTKEKRETPYSLVTI